MKIDSAAPVSASAQALIHAPPETVWAVLTTLESWPDWNPGVQRIRLDGALEPGSSFHWKAGGLPIRSVLEVVESGRRVGWSGRAPPGIRALHLWHLEERPEGTLVTTEESFDGWLPRLMPRRTTSVLAASLEQGLAALKVEAETRAQRAAG